MRTCLVVVATVGLLAGCATTPSLRPTVQTGSEAEVTVDGLHRVDNSVMALAYMKPDLDLRGYTAIMLDPVHVAYQRDPGGRRTSGAPGAGAANFALNANQMDNLKSWFQEAVVEALSGDGGYRIVDTPGPDVLRITAELIDLIVRIPTQGAASRGRMAVRSFGEVTLVLEARDSQSGEILARAADRRDPTAATASGLVEVFPGRGRRDTQRLFEYWADLVRERLDELREVDMAAAR